MDSLLEYLKPLDQQQSPMHALVEQLCNLNSGTMNLEGLAIVAKRLVDEFSVLGGEVKLVETPPLTIINELGEKVEQPLGSMIHITKWPDSKRKILLCIHMDTVYGIDHPFQQCRMVDQDRLNGPGVADAKGGLVVMLNALKTLEQSPLAGKIGWEVLINPDEEIGSPGSVALINEIAARCEFGLLFEPSLPDGTLVSLRKGSGNFSFIVRGRSAHSGREFEKGRNAIVALSRLMVEIDNLNQDPEVTFNPGRVTGGGALNVVPDLAIGRVNVRIKTDEQKSEVERAFDAIVERFNQADGISVEKFGSFRSPPKQVCEQMIVLQDRIERCGSAIGLDIRWRETGGACDGNKFAAAGLPNIDSLGPRGGEIHSPNEFLILESLVPRAKLTALILLSFAAEQE